MKISTIVIPKCEVIERTLAGVQQELLVLGKILSSSLEILEML